ncbi:MAG: hypothetical protein GY719_27560, partial [bacterium]|nr:hypothetical protein [bacterium]
MNRRRLITLIICALAAGAQFVAAEPVPDAGSRAEAESILEGWSRGRDMTEKAVLYAGARRAQQVRRPPLPRDLAPARLAASLEALGAAARKGATTDEVRAAYSAFEIQDLLERDELKEIGARLAAAGAADEILARHEQARTAYLDASDRLRQALGSGSLEKDGAGLSVETLALLEAHEATVPMLRSSLLPYRRQDLAPRDVALQPTVVPSYLDATGPTSSPADLAPTPEAPLAEEILAKAEELGYDYVRIHEFVHDEIDTEWYAGSQKGALGTLRQGSGNDVDQASLLVALFRASSLPARYVTGVAELPLAYFQQQVGLGDAGRVADFLARAGVARTPVIRGGAVSGFHVEQTWVSAYLPYTNYRGAVVDFSGKTWLPLAPAIQDYERAPASGVLAAMGFDADELLADYLAAPQALEPLATLRAAVEDHLLQAGGGSYEEQLATRTALIARLGILPNSLPFAAAAVTAEGAAVAEDQRVEVRLSARSGTGDGAPVILDHTLALAELVGRRLTVSYVPATADDHQVVNAFGGLDQVPAYLVRLRPQLRIGGRRVAVGEGSLPMAVPHRLEIELSGPFGTERTGQTFLSGSYHALALGAQRFVEHVGEADPEDEEFLGAALLSGVAYGFGTEWDAAERELAALLDVAVARPLPSVAIASNAVEAPVVLGLPRRLEWRGVTLDAALRVAEPVAREDAAAARDWMRLSALQGSALEHLIFERQFLVESQSADKALGLARQQGIEVLRLDAANVDALLPALQHPQAVRSAVEDWARQGFEVEIPRQQLALNAWVGSAWRVEDPASAAAGYFLAGGLAGGATTEEPGDWVLDFVADALAHLRADPNLDPLAGASVRKIPGGDFQVGTVGESFPLELTVQVLDSVGRPVKGAEVEFRSLAGGGELRSDGAGSAGTPTLTTDAGGFASVELVAGTRVLDNVVLVQRHPDDEEPTWALQHLVSAMVASGIGQLAIEQPFEAIAYPGPAASLTRTDTSETEFPDSSIAMWTDSMVIEVMDAYGNAVSNAEVEASAQEPILGWAEELCGDDGAGAERLHFFAAGVLPDGSFRDCPSSFPSRGECGSEVLRLKTGAAGRAIVGVIFGGSPLVELPARVELRQVDLSVSITESADPLRIPASGGASPPPVPLIYQIEVANRGSHPATSARVELQLGLPDGVSIEEVEPSRGTWVEPSWTLGDLAVDATETLTVTLLVAPGTVAGPEELGVFAQVIAPEDPVVGVGDDSAIELTSLELVEDGEILPSQSQASEPVASPDGAIGGKALAVIAPLELFYSSAVIRIDSPGPFGQVIGTCEPHPSGFLRARNFLVHAATKVSEPYPLPIEVLHFGADPDDCRAVEVHDCRDACLAPCGLIVDGVPFPGEVTDCAYCVGGGSGCTFQRWERDCEDRVWAVRRSQLLPEECSASLTNSGSATAPVQAEDGLAVLTTLTAGPDPGDHGVEFEGSYLSRGLYPNPQTGELEIRTNPIHPSIPFFEVSPSPIGSFHGLQLEITDIAPEQPDLTEGGVTSTDTTFSYRIEPADYRANSVTVRIEADDAFVSAPVGSSLSGEGQAVLPQGTRLEAGQQHEARLLLNAGSAIEVTSDRVPVPLARQIIRSVDDPFVLSQDTDLAAELHCQASTSLDFTLNRAADVTLWLQRAVGVGVDGVEYSDEEILLVENEAFEEGAHSHPVTLHDLPPGDYRGTLRAVDEAGLEEEESEFLALAENRMSDHQRVGQTMLRGVNLWKGNLVLSRQDMSVRGRGAPLELTRTYVSSASQVPGSLGVGWMHNWESRVEVTPCGEVVLTGGDGSGLRFVDDGTGGLTARPGTHGRMVADAEAGTFDFFTVGGHRHRYVPVQEGRWELERVVDPDGNATVLTYSGTGADRLLRRVTDEAGRALDFFYQERASLLWRGDVLTRVTGPDGLEVSFGYDAYGNLSAATREGNSRQDLYTYQQVPGWDFGARWALEGTIDGLNGADTRYVYQVADIQAVPGQGVSSLLVREIHAPVGGVTSFVWDLGSLAAHSGPAHRVIDRRGEETGYRFNDTGNPLEIVDPLEHATAMEWDVENLVMSGLTDGKGTATDVTHDGYGNPLTETVTVSDFDGTEHTYTVTHTYVPAGQAPFQRNLVATRTDRNGHTTTYEYDAQGNLVSRSIEVTDIAGETTTVAVHHTYSANGDRLTSTDARGGVTTYRYDSNGYLEEVTDPLGNTTLTEWNDRSLPVKVTDARGHRTFMDYDRLGRLTRRQHSDHGVERIEYFDGLNLKIATDARGGVTRTTSDDEGRVIHIQDAVGNQKVFEYDAEGNKILESRWFGGHTPRDDVIFEYDAAGRLIYRREAAIGRVTTFEYDEVGNLTRERMVSEVVDDGFAPHVTEADYDELSRPIEVRRQLGEGFVITKTRFDGEGNKILELDPLERTTVMDYDALNRLLRVDEAGLRERRHFYDPSGNLSRSELDVLVGEEPA